MSDTPAPGTPLQIQIDIDPVTAQGSFINLAVVNHTDTEFTVDMLYLQPQAPRATVRARAILTPRHMKRLLLAMQSSVDKYERAFGEIDLGNVPHFPGVPLN